MNKRATKRLYNKKARVLKDINKSLPVAVLPFGDFILILSCSKDHRRRIKRALDRIVTIEFGSEGYDLQRFASQEAKAQAFQVSYENITAASVAERVSMVLRRNLKHPRHSEINGALILVRLDLYHPSRDEVVIVSYDGSMSFVDYFFSGTDNSKASSCGTCADGKGDSCVAGDENVVSSGPKDIKDEEEEEDEGMGKALPAFQEFVSKTGPDNTVSVFYVIEKFGIECVKLFGEDIYIQAVQMSRSAAKAKRFGDVMETMHGPWGGLMKEIRKLKKEFKKQNGQ